MQAHATKVCQYLCSEYGLSLYPNTTSTAGKYPTEMTGCGDLGSPSFQYQSWTMPQCTKVGDLASSAATAVIQSLTTGGTAASTRLSGSMNMNVANPQAAVSDNAFKAAVEAGIAQTCGVPTSYVTASLSVARRLNDIDRRLAGAIKVDYTVDVPATSSVTAATAKGALESATTATLTSNIKTKLSSATLANASNAEVTVTSKAALQSSVLPTNGAPEGTTTSVDAPASLGRCTTLSGLVLAITLMAA